MNFSFSLSFNDKKTTSENNSFKNKLFVCSGSSSNYNKVEKALKEQPGKRLIEMFNKRTSEIHLMENYFQIEETNVHYAQEKEDEVNYFNEFYFSKSFKKKEKNGNILNQSEKISNFKKKNSSFILPLNSTTNMLNKQNKAIESNNTNSSNSTYGSFALLNLKRKTQKISTKEKLYHAFIEGSNLKDGKIN